MDTQEQVDLPSFTREEFNGGGWRKQAACRDLATSEFFQESAGGNAHYLMARATCFNCPVRKECFDFAADNSIAHGIWGGFTYRERLAVRSGKRPFELTVMDIARSTRRNTTTEALAKLLRLTKDEVRQLIAKEIGK